MNYTFLFLILLSIVSTSNKACASSKACADLFSVTKSEIHLFPVPLGELQIRELGNGYFALVSGIPYLQVGSVFEVRTKNDIRMPEEGSRLLLLKKFEPDKTSNIKQGRWIVVPDKTTHSFFFKVYTSKAELEEIITTVVLGEPPKQQFDQTDLRVLEYALRSSLEIDESIAKEIAMEFGKLPNSVNLFTLRQFPRIINETLQKYGLTLVFLDENGNPT